MARKNNSRKTSRSSRVPEKVSSPRTENASYSEDASQRDYGEIIKELVQNPAVRYIAGGIATAVFTRLANRMSERYPELTSFIKENLDNLDGNIGDYSRKFGREDTTARH